VIRPIELLFLFTEIDTEPTRCRDLTDFCECPKSPAEQTNVRESFLPNCRPATGNVWVRCQVIERFLSHYRWVTATKSRQPAGQRAKTSKTAASLFSFGFFPFTRAKRFGLRLLIPKFH
jgi:hypothetical protein